MPRVMVGMPTFFLSAKPDSPPDAAAGGDVHRAPAGRLFVEKGEVGLGARRNLTGF